nr:novel protein containing zona pellucida-like domains (si:dkeyp-50f7.2) [Danio rerio]
MSWLLGICTLWLLMVVVLSQKFVEQQVKNFDLVAAQNFNQRTGLRTECLGSYMKLTIDKSIAFGNQVEIDVVNGSQIEPLTPALAAKCGFSVDSDPWGNHRIFASILNCFAGDEDDTVMEVDMRVRVRGRNNMQSDVYPVTKSCTYDRWASREILCERNYMEVSVNRMPEEITALRRQKPKLARAFSSNQWAGTVSEAITSKYNIWRMVFFTPEQKAMVLEDALKAGHGITTTRSRLAIRTGYDMPETYVENVSGVPMKIIKVTTYFKKQWSVTMLDTVAACPIGGLSFTDEMITWSFPWKNHLLGTSDIIIHEMLMGIDGRLIDSAHMAARGFILTRNDDFIVMKLPIGGPDGYTKSGVVENLYHTRYVIEPMLELLWSEGGMDSTRYRVLFPVKTPLMPRPLQLVDLTVVEQRIFDVVLGPFLHDVELVNITFSGVVLTVIEANARGFNIQDQVFQNGSKSFRLNVPFTDTLVVRTQTDLLATTYTLPIIYGFMIVPEYVAFSYVTSVQVTFQDIVLPTVTGSCDKEQFYITISNGNLGVDYNIMLGTRDLNQELRAEYGIRDNGTHLTLAVPFLSLDVAFELMYSTSLRARVDVLVWEPVSKRSLSDFSLACNFPMTMTECFSNGSISALAVKVESVPQLVPKNLRLQDPSCRPKFSNDRFAYFSFDANSCGTTRTFYDGVMMYQNEITSGDGLQVFQQANKELASPSPDYRVTVSCFYTLNETQMISFTSQPLVRAPMVETGYGELHVVMRLALDGSYSNFYAEEDYPVARYLRSPLFFEVMLLQSTDPRIELVLENCWATVNEGRESTPRWDLIVDGCVNLGDTRRTHFHSVTPEMAQYPTHVKHFEIKMFTFMKDSVVSQDQIFVHCDAVLCAVNQADGICQRQCPSPNPLNSRNKVRRDVANDRFQRTLLSSGKIHLSSS